MPSGDDRIDPEAELRRPDRSVAALLADLAHEIGILLRQEIALFKAELQEKFRLFGQGAGAAVAGGLIVFSGWLALLAAAVLGLSEILAPWLSALIVGVVVTVFGVGLLMLGKSRLDGDALALRRTLSSLREDERWIRDEFS
jgi:Putative Actinobacterial Holin-X, holin superfamily III